MPVLPISIEVSLPDAVSQSLFAQEARGLVAECKNVEGTVTDSGLHLRGLSDLDLEIALALLLTHYPNAKTGAPEVAYVWHPEILEPYYRVTVDTPAEFVEKVVADLSARRGYVEAVEQISSDPRIVGAIPVSECFGYSTELRALTRGLGAFSVVFAGYRPAPRIGRGPASVA